MRTIGLELIAWIAISMAVLGPGLWTDPHTVPGGVWTDVHNSMWSMQFAADAAWALGAETNDWATKRRTAQDAGVRYVLMR